PLRSRPVRALLGGEIAPAVCCVKGSASPYGCKSTDLTLALRSIPPLSYRLPRSTPRPRAAGSGGLQNLETMTISFPLPNGRGPRAVVQSVGAENAPSPERPCLED